MKKKILFLFIALLGLSWYTVISSITGNPKKAEECLAKATELEEKEIYVDAISEYEKVLEYAPEDEAVALKMAQAYLNIGNTKEYIRLCRELAEKNQKSEVPLNTLMTYYVEQGEEASAVKYLKEFADTYPKNTTAQKWLVQLKGSYTELYNRYEEIGDVYGKSMVVKTEEGSGIADAFGTEILDADFQETNPYSRDGLALVRRNENYQYVDEDGQTRLVPDESYGELGMMSSGRTIASVNGKYAYLNEKLEPITEFEWEQLTLVNDGIGAGCRNGKWAILDENGKEKTEYIYDDVKMDFHGFCSGQKRVFLKQGDSYQLIDKKGKRKGELSFDDAKCFSEEGYAAVCKDGMWGFVDKDGELEIEYQFEDAESFSNGFAPVCQGGLWGYIDESGALVVKPEFERVTSITEQGTAAVLDTEWKLIQLNWFQ